MKFLSVIVLGLVLSLSAFAQGGMGPGPGTAHTVSACGAGVDISNGWCQIAHTVQGSANTTSVTTTGVDTSSADLIVLVISSYCLGGHTNVVGDVSDSKVGNTWNSITSQCDAGGGQSILMVYTKPVQVGAAHTFTVSNALPTFPSMEVYAVSGSHATPFDQLAGATSAGSSVTSLATTSITPSQNNELVISGLTMAGTPNTGTPTINASMTIADFSNGSAGAYVGGGLAYITQSTAAGINPTWSWVTSAPAIAVIASFKHS